MRSATSGESDAFGYHRHRMADPKIDFLRRVPLFEELDDHTLREIANASVEQRWEAGQEIVRQGDTGVGMFVIRSGKVEITQERDGKREKEET